MVDRGAMTPNEWRKILNLSPIDGGDIPVRRLDTAPLEDLIQLRQLKKEVTASENEYKRYYRKR